MKSPHPTEKSLSEKIQSEIQPDAIIAALRDGLTATATDRSGVSRPDNRTRLDAAKLILAYSIGVPIQRSESVTVNLDADSALGLKERLANSPAMREALRRALDQAG